MTPLWLRSPEARYPLALNHGEHTTAGHSSRWAALSDRRRCVSGHFPADFDGFRPEPPDANLEPDYAERFKLSGYNKIQQEEHHEFFKRWTTEDKFPRFLCVEIQHACPYFDDSCKRQRHR